jgi:hypothetical protein
MNLQKHFLIISFSLLFFTNIFSQPAVDIPFSSTDSTSYSIEISVGLDLTATNCIDPQLGEFDIIFPMPGLFDIRFDLIP